MTSKILVIVNGRDYVAKVSVATHAVDGGGLVREETTEVRGNADEGTQAVREFYIGSNQTVVLTEAYDPLHPNVNKAGEPVAASAEDAMADDDKEEL